MPTDTSTTPSPPAHAAHDRAQAPEQSRPATPADGYDDMRIPDFADYRRVRTRALAALRGGRARS